MERFLLFIRDDGREHVVSIYPDEAAARSALADYVRGRVAEAGRGEHGSDDEAIATYFARGDAMYAVARVAPSAR